MLNDKRKNVSTNEMTIEEFQRIAERHLACGRVRIEPFQKTVSSKLEVIEKQVDEIIYLQSLSAMGLGGALHQVSLKLNEETYFITDAVEKVLINDFIVDSISIDNASSVVYMVGFKAISY